MASSWSVGDKVSFKEKPAVVGVVKWTGTIDDKPLVGLELEKPLRSGHDGTYQGTKLYDCKALHGIVVVPDRLQLVGSSSPAPASPAPSSPAPRASAPASPAPASPAARASAPSSPAPSSPAASSPAAASAPASSKQDRLFVEALEKELGELRAENETLRRDKRAAEAAVEAATSNGQAFETKVEELTVQLAKERVLHRQELEKAQNEQQSGLKTAQRKWEEEKHSLEERIAELEDNCEELVLGKQLLEEQLEDVNADKTRLEKQLEAARRQVQQQQAASDGEPAGASTSTTSDGDVIELQSKCERLESALSKLAKVSKEAQDALKKRVETLEAENARLVEAEDARIDAEARLLNAEEELEATKQALDDAHEAEAMAVELSAQNAKLKTRVQELQTQVDELEELRELSDELEVTHKETEKQLNKQLLAKEVELLNAGDTIKAVQSKLDEADKTIQLYHNRAHALQQRIAELESAQADVSAEAGQVSDQLRSVVDENLRMRAQLVDLSEMKVRSLLARVAASASQRQLQFLRSFLPARIFSHEYDAIQSVTALQHVEFKCGLIVDHLEQQDNALLLQQAPGAAPVAMHQLESVLLSVNIKLAVLPLRSVAAVLTRALQNCQDRGAVAAIGRLYYELNFVQPELDRVVALIAKRELNETFAVHVPQLAAAAQRFADVVQASPFSEAAAPVVRLLHVAQLHVQKCLAVDSALSAQLQRPADESPWPACVDALKRLLKAVPSDSHVLGDDGGAASSAVVDGAVAATAACAHLYQQLWERVQPQITTIADEQLREALLQTLADHGDNDGEQEGCDELGRWWACCRRRAEPMLAGLTALLGQLDTGSLAVHSLEPVSEDTTVWRTVPAAYQAEIELAVGLQGRFEQVKQQLAVQEQTCQKLSEQLARMQAADKEQLAQLRHSQKVAADKAQALKDEQGERARERVAFENEAEQLHNQIEQLHEQIQSLKKHQQHQPPSAMAVPSSSLAAAATSSSSSSSSSLPSIGDDSSAPVLDTTTMQSRVAAMFLTQIGALQRTVADLAQAEAQARSTLAADIVDDSRRAVGAHAPQKTLDALHKYYSQMSRAKVVKIPAHRQHVAPMLPLPKLPPSTFFKVH